MPNHPFNLPQTHNNKQPFIVPCVIHERMLPNATKFVNSRSNSSVHHLIDKIAIPFKPTIGMEQNGLVASIRQHPRSQSQWYFILKLPVRFRNSHLMDNPMSFPCHRSCGTVKDGPSNGRKYLVIVRRCGQLWPFEIAAHRMEIARHVHIPPTYFSKRHCALTDSNCCNWRITSKWSGSQSFVVDTATA